MPIKAWLFLWSVQMPNLLEEDRISFTELAKHENVNVCSVWRWAQKGVKGVQLEWICRGGKRQTSWQAFSRFVAATTAATTCEQPKVRTNRQRQADVARAKAELAADGI
jgi:hypothetical protein